MSPISLRHVKKKVPWLLRSLTFFLLAKHPTLTLIERIITCLKCCSLFVLLSVLIFIDNLNVVTKGAPAQESQMGSRFISPAIGCEKNFEAPQFW